MNDISKEALAALTEKYWTALRPCRSLTDLYNTIGLFTEALGEWEVAIEGGRVFVYHDNRSEEIEVDTPDIVVRNREFEGDPDDVVRMHSYLYDFIEYGNYVWVYFRDQDVDKIYQIIYTDEDDMVGYEYVEDKDIRSRF